MHGFGRMLKDYLEYYKISQTDFAERLGISVKHMNEILNENADISVDLMLAISLITDISPDLIFKVENQKKVANYLINEYHNEKNIKEFLNTFYIKEMVNKKWIKLKLESSFSQTAIDLLDYLNIRNFDILNKYLDKKVLYKKNDDANLKKIYLWIKRCDSLIKTREISNYKKENLNNLLKDLKLERTKSFDENKLIQIFNKYGIYLVIEDALKGTKIRGCMMVKNSNPAIYITKYLKEKSSFYFTLYHEISHIKTDYNKAKNKIIIDAEENISEINANKFALNQMIDENLWKEIKNNINIAETICNNNNIPLCFLYSRMAYEGIISYKSKEYNSNRENIL